ncbi:MAG TPA: rod shape-determining protein RodA [bacterium]|jgi:rod shape determining protein RodA|nr:rod shape-determining protein RodA [bacterium]
MAPFTLLPDARRWDRSIIILAMLLCAFGLVLIVSATAADPGLRGLPLKQALWVLMGVVAMVLAAVVDHRGLANLGYLAYGLVVLLLGVVLLTARRSSHGATSWLDLGVFYVEPSELAKVALILALARALSDSPRVRTFTGLLPALGLMAGLQILVLKAPDLGTSLILLPITLTMLLVAGARLWHLGLLALGMGAAGPLAWPFLHPYQRDRILSFLNPQSDALGTGYNAIQSQIAVGSGGWFGQGYMRGTQSQLHFVPFHHTDFVFSVLGEEGGFIASVLLLALLLALLARIAEIAMKARDMSGSLVAAGMLAWLGTQSFVNIGMNLGLLPVTGIPLPLVSYGGSSTIAAFFGLGLVLSVRRDSLGSSGDR